LRWTTRKVLFAAILVLGLLVTFEFPLFWKLGCCLPAAKLAALFLGVLCVPAADGYWIETDLLPIHVSLACSAARFFVLLSWLCVAAVLNGNEKTALRRAFLAIAVAYVSTLAANVTRIVLGWHAETWVRSTLPSGFWSATHAGVGIFVFLIATYFFINWRFQDGRTTQTA
jgi:exosortase/archaeosortase family protein